MNNRKAPEKYRKVFIGGLNYRVTGAQLRAYFKRYGNVVDCAVIRDQKTKRSKGFGFVTFRYVRMVDRVQSTRPHKIHGKVVFTKRAVPRECATELGAYLNIERLFVKNLPQDINEIDLMLYFMNYGEILDIDLAKHNTGEPKGFAYVQFTDYDCVDKILLQRNHIIRGQRVEVNKAFPKWKMDMIRKEQEFLNCPRCRHLIQPETEENSDDQKQKKIPIEKKK